MDFFCLLVFWFSLFKSLIVRLELLSVVDFCTAHNKLAQFQDV